MPMRMHPPDYKPVDSQMISHILETQVDGVAYSEQIRIEHVALNPRLADNHFTEPE